MADIANLRRRRAAIKARMTRLKSKAEQVPEDNVSREEIETYLSRLEEIQCEFENVQDKINDTAEGEPTDAEAFEETVFEERYLELKIKMKRRLNALPAQQGESRSTTSDEMLSSMLLQQGEIIRQMSQRGDGVTTNNGDAIERLFEQQTQLIRSIASGSGATNQESRVKLPVVRLPTFDGRVEDWKRFSETFQSMIHANESIPNIQKFQYLVTSLSGTAAKIIEAIELTDANYVIAWELLKRRFDDPRAIKKKHIQCLFTMPRVEKESAAAIRSLLDYTSKHLRVLKSLNLPTDSWNELVIHMMEAKLDATTLRAWEQSPTATDATLITFNEFLERRRQTLERMKHETRRGCARPNPTNKKRRLEFARNTRRWLASPKLGNVICAMETIYYIDVKNFWLCQ
ncbi:PREDICTED: uncharacterized protein LOC105556770 [Vollenhovia emeryi]|uniref:uncharacterized protein LOC105556770 n=1 Tax=Vollenhovia emeryi TaxID=411798 RepID=UPI0005F4DEF7|nr:PREDICTED: uncharacterized protein LOC105556770 [Vollenhovia emeryi]